MSDAVDPNDSIDLDQLKKPSIEDVREGREAYENPEKLRTLYHDLEWSQAMIADFWDVDQSTISRVMGRLGIETRPPMHERGRSISKSKQAKGKVQIAVPDCDGDYDRFYRHQLVILLATDENGEWEVGPHEVFAPWSVVHHSANLPAAVDAPPNLELMGAQEHIEMHAAGYTGVESPMLATFFKDYEPASDSEMGRLKEWERQIDDDNE